MIKTEIINNKFIRHYAEDDKGVKYKIKQVETGVMYDEAVDLIPCKYNYVETEEVINTEVNNG